MPRQAKPAMQSPLKLLCNHLISSHLVHNRTLKRYKAERSPSQQENVCSIRSEVSSSVMTCVVFFVVPNMCFRCAEYACEERECKCPCMPHAGERRIQMQCVYAKGAFKGNKRSTIRRLQGLHRKKRPSRSRHR